MTARELDILPHDALLLGVRIAAARVADVEQRRHEVLVEQGGRVEHPDVLRLTNESRRERTLMFKASKAACDAGIAERLVRQVELETQLLMRVMGRTIDRMELSNEQRVRVLGFVQEELLAIEGEPEFAGGHLPSTGPANPQVGTPLHSGPQSRTSEPASDPSESTAVDRVDVDALIRETGSRRLAAERLGIPVSRLDRLRRDAPAHQDAHQAGEREASEAQADRSTDSPTPVETERTESSASSHPTVTRLPLAGTQRPERGDSRSR